MITININKAKVIAHNIRRSARAAEFAPYDEVIAKQIPGQLENAELARQSIRDKYAQIQTQIDQANEIGAIKQALQLS
jgi:hypothetical protein